LDANRTVQFQRKRNNFVNIPQRGSRRIAQIIDTMELSDAMRSGILDILREGCRALWKPDRNRKKPLYLQISEHIEQRISFGELPPGSLLPSERKLAEQLGVNRSTIVQAYEELRASGMIERAAGSGTRVSKHKWGMAPKQTPNWNRYVEGGTFLPNLPFMRRIREGIQRGNAFINFASGELSHDLSPNESIQDILANEPFREALNYGEPQGFLPLRTSLTSFLKEQREINATNESILVTSGSQQSLYLITQCLLSPGDAIAIENPSYGYSLPMFQSAGLRLYGLPVDEHGVHPDDIRRLYRQHRIRMVFLNPNYQNPTGTVLSDERRSAVLDVCEQLGIPIVEDDPFSLTSFDEPSPPPLKTIDRNGSVIYIGSLSKVAASGLRIGWMVAPQSVIHRLADARLQMDFGLSIFPQWVASHLLQTQELDKHMQRLRTSLKRRRDLLIDALRAELPEMLSFEVPKGGLNLWCKLAEPADDELLLENGIKKGVLFVPGSVYGTEPGYVRLSYARPPEDDIGTGVLRFAEALRTTYDRRA